MKDIITREHVFNHSIDSVWNAITKSEEISTWFIEADFKAEVGYPYTFTASEEHGCAKIQGVVKAATPYTLVYTWVIENTDVETTVTWKLEKVSDGTRLFLEHRGISQYPGENAIKFFDDYSNGWKDCVKELTAYLKSNVHAG